jgi:hypothetical protein
MNISKYKFYSADQLQELSSNFIVSKWSYSRVDQYSRHQKAFEMRYIYGIFGRISATTIGGIGYHDALKYYWIEKQKGNVIDLVDLQKVAYASIDEIEANKWKLQKTTPTMEKAQAKATAIATALLENFAGEKSTYEEDVAEILGVELRIDDFVIVNGVEIPLPLTAILDQVVRTKEGKIAIIDHKSRAKFTDDEEMKLSIGTQAITYVIAYETAFGESVDEVWFIENKHSKNQDGSPQIVKHKVVIDNDTRRLYEALLYEPLQQMLKAVSNPDHVYTINHSDNFVEKGELYNFWCMTMIAEIGDFNIEDGKKELVAMRLKKIRDAALATVTPTIIRNFKANASEFIQYDLSSKDMSQEQKIEHALRNFKVIARVAHSFEGYSSNTYLLEVSAGVKVASVYQYRLDMANALDVANVRISKDLVVYEGKSYLSLDIAKKRDRFLYFEPSDLQVMRIPLGKDNFGRTIVWDLENESTPHMMVCGTTGSGKSVFIKSSIEYALLAGVEEIYLLDPKNEFGKYRRAGVTVVSEILEIEETMKALVDRMEQMKKDGEHQKILVIFDELAYAIAIGRKGKQLDIMENVQVGNYAPKKDPLFGMMIPGAPKYKLQKVGEIKSLEQNMALIVQLGRSIGFRVIAAMQRASTKIIDGDAKVNFPIRICFRVTSEVDSRVVLDEPGAEALSDKGDGLIISPEYMGTTRFQAYFIPDKVITAHHDADLNATIVQ